MTDRRRARRTGPTLEALEGRHLLNSPSATGTSINTGLAGLWGAAADTRDATGAFQLTLTFNQGQDATYLAQDTNSDAAADFGDTWSQAWGDVFAARSLEAQATTDYQSATKVSDPLAGQLVQAGNAKMEQAKPLAQQAIDDWFKLNNQYIQETKDGKFNDPPPVIAQNPPAQDNPPTLYGGVEVGVTVPGNRGGANRHQHSHQSPKPLRGGVNGSQRSHQSPKPQTPRAAKPTSGPKLSGQQRASLEAVEWRKWATAIRNGKLKSVDTTLKRKVVPDDGPLSVTLDYKVYRDPSKLVVTGSHSNNSNPLGPKFAAEAQRLLEQGGGLPAWPQNSQLEVTEVRQVTFSANMVTGAKYAAPPKEPPHLIIH